ncbi:MAG: HAMP domain-containing protein [Nitrospirae bacterium]|nr:HAMP domain-containing protein [Nitrospirota bacterium]
MKKLHPVVFFMIIFLFVIASFAVEFHFLRLESVPFLTKLFLLLPINLTIIALFTLMFFVGKSLIRLYFERKHKILGYKFKTKFVVILVVLTLIPAALLFIISSGLITNYIDRWFVPQLRQPLDRSIEIAKSVYEIEKQKTLDYAKALSKGESTLSDYKVKHLSIIPADATETIRSAFEGKAGTEVISGKRGDIIRAVVPEFKDGKQTGVLIVESLIPVKITTNVENIKDAYENYLTLESWKVPIKINYLLILGFLTMIVVFMALWIALRISRGITDPIQSLALATEQVASGNLDIKVDIEKTDEIGLLINSFNDMVRKLKFSKESLQSAYLYIKNILDNINSGVIMLDTSGTISMINGAACSILNINQQDVVNKTYRELMLRIDSEELHNLVHSIEGKVFKPVKKELKALINNKRIILSVFITSLRDSQKYIGLLVVFDDITDIIEAQKARTWQDIARKMAHEIKNPLTPIKLSTERMIKKWEIQDPDFDHIFRRSAKTIIKEVESLKRLVDEFSRYGKMPEIIKKPASISTIIDEVVDLYKDYKDIQINVIMPENLPLLEIDYEQIKRALINIFDNAVQAIITNGKIDINVSFDIDANKAFINIADNGPGIRDEDREKLFLPYFSTKKDGTGLGLAIANRIITEHRGHISFRDNNPKGTVFTIEIPIKDVAI